MKTTLSKFLFGVVTLSYFLVTSSNGFAVCLDPPGDLNQSGDTTVADVQCGVLLTLWGLGISDYLPSCIKNQPSNGDLDCSGNLTVADVQILITHTLGQPINKVLDTNQDGCVDVCQDAVCGDGLCSADENCSECEQDCAECPSMLSFNKDWTETLDGPIVAAKKLRIYYDPARLPNCRGSKYGFPAWSISLYYSFDLSKAAQSLPVVGKSPDQWELVPQIVTIDIPENAENVWFWAQNTSAFGCVEWDSDFGKNYEFPVFTQETLSGPIGWAGNFQFVESTGSTTKFLGDVNPAWYTKSLASQGTVTWVQAEVWVPGITDRSYSNGAVTAEIAKVAVDAWVYTPAVGTGGPAGPWGEASLQFVGKYGNNFVYRWDPTPVVNTPGFVYGNYPYTLRFASALSEQIWTVWGTQDQVPRWFNLLEM
ncbi:MAG: hypothetical protein HUU55_14250 [Myxococcales bacterium]|nr:hypothetical protein [Myxococcales bacterium]